MLDIKFVRENPDVVKENIRKKFQDQKIPMVDEVIALDQENRNIKQEVESLRANKNKISKSKTCGQLSHRFEIILHCSQISNSDCAAQ